MWRYSLLLLAIVAPHTRAASPVVRLPTTAKYCTSTTPYKLARCPNQVIIGARTEVDLTVGGRTVLRATDTSLTVACESLPAAHLSLSPSL